MPVTHELKTPVTSIRLHLETLLARGDSVSDDRRREFYGVMLEDSQRLMQTIEQILHTGQAGRTPLSLERHDLRALADECVQFTRTRRHLADSLVRLSPGAEAIEIMGDREELRGAIVNLLDNAVKFSGDHVDVEVDVRREGDRAVVRVRDQGPGLPPYEAKRIFRRFYRVPGPLTQRIKGTGLGLFIVQSAAKRHGGRAYAVSQGAGTGATFCIELPAALTSDGVSDDGDASGCGGRTAHRVRPALQSGGRRTRCRNGGDRAKPRSKSSACGRDSVDCMVLDVMLPDLDGYAVASAARAQGWFTPILMLTARGRAEDVLRGFEAGADDYLPKPFELSILVARINALLRRHGWQNTRGQSHRRLGRLHVCGTDRGLRRPGAARRRRHAPSDADGDEPLALSRAARRPGGVAQEHARGRVEPARGH